MVTDKKGREVKGKGKKIIQKENVLRKYEIIERSLQ